MKPLYQITRLFKDNIAGDQKREDRPVEEGLSVEFPKKVSEGDGEADSGESGGQCQVGISRKRGREVLYKNIGG